MGGLEIRELECFLVLADELHFGRTGERLYVSQGRVSQLVQSLERRIGARLVERTSRRVCLTPLGERFLASLRPAYEALRATVEDVTSAARGVAGRLRIGFQGSANEHLVAAVAAFRDHHPDCATDVVELPLSDPFGAARRGDVDVAVVLVPAREDDLVLGPVFSRQPQCLAISVRHPLAARTRLTAEDLAATALISVAEPAPGYWRRAQAPGTTPAGRAVPPGPAVHTLQEGLSLIAAGAGAMLLCRPTGEQHRRSDVVHLPVDGLPESALGMVWHRDRENARVRAFATAVAGAG